MRGFLFVFLYFMSAPSFATSQTGTLVKKTGKVFALVQPKAKSENRKDEVLFENLYFVRKEARLGSRIEAGEAIQTATDGQAKIIFGNGDSISVGPGSSYLLKKTSPSSQEKDPSLNLFYGKIRAIISHKGPRNNMEIKTPSAVAGVRGTDLFVSYHGAEGAKVAVLRGKVEVKTIASQNPNNESESMPSKISQIQTGQSAWVQPLDKSKNHKPFIVVAETYKTDLLDIQKNSVILNPETSPVTEDTQKELVTLEKKCLETVLEDIKSSDPLLSKKIEDKKLTQLNEINTLVVADLYQQAPESPTSKDKIKPGVKDLNEPDEDIYKKYFQPPKNP